MSALRTFEVVDAALDAYLRAGDFMTCADGRAWVRKSNALHMVCVDAGMPYDHAAPSEWAAEYVANTLVLA